jgi:hypothetical protein
MRPRESEVRSDPRVASIFGYENPGTGRSSDEAGLAVHDEGGYSRPSRAAKEVFPVATIGSPAEDALVGTGNDASVGEDREGVHNPLQGLGRERSPSVTVIRGSIDLP